MEFPETFFNASDTPESPFFQLGACRIQTSSCKKFLALCFLDADVAWTLDLKDQAPHKFNWNESKLQEERCSISFKDDCNNLEPCLEPMEAIDVRSEKKAELVATQAVLSSICGQHEEGLAMINDQLPSNSDHVARAYEKVGIFAREGGAFDTASEALGEAHRLYRNFHATSEPHSRVLLNIGMLDDNCMHLADNWVIISFLCEFLRKSPRQEGRLQR